MSPKNVVFGFCIVIHPSDDQSAPHYPFLFLLALFACLTLRLSLFSRGPKTILSHVLWKMMMLQKGGQTGPGDELTIFREFPPNGHACNCLHGILALDMTRELARICNVVV